MGAFGMEMDDVECLANEDLSQREGSNKIQLVSDHQGPALYVRGFEPCPQGSFGRGQNRAPVLLAGKIRYEPEYLRFSSAPVLLRIDVKNPKRPLMAVSAQRPFSPGTRAPTASCT